MDSQARKDRLFHQHDEQHKKNFLELEHAGITISVGGEIGEVGKENSNEQELHAYLDNFNELLEKEKPGAVGISKRQHGIAKSLIASLE